MARPTDEFAIAWKSLAGADPARGWRTIPVTPAGRVALSAGRHFPEGAQALLAGFAVPALPVAQTLPDDPSLRVERASLPDTGRTWLAVTRRPAGSPVHFLAMVCDVAGALDALAGADDGLALRVFLGRVRAWQAFMGRGAPALSTEGRIALCGVLEMLSAVMAAGLAPAAALAAWTGPMGGAQDFEPGTGALVVGATLSRSGFPLRIASLAQLDDTRRRPVLAACVRLRQAEAGRTLTERVDALERALADDPEAARLLAERLIATGFARADAAGCPQRLEPAGMRIVRVGPDFPRLTRANVPSGILNAEYEIDLEGVKAVSMSPDEALRAMGAV